MVIIYFIVITFYSFEVIVIFMIFIIKYWNYRLLKHYFYEIFFDYAF